VSTMGAAAPFMVEQDVPGAARFFELKVSHRQPEARPPSGWAVSNGHQWDADVHRGRAHAPDRRSALQPGRVGGRQPGFERFRDRLEPSQLPMVSDTTLLFRRHNATLTFASIAWRRGDLYGRGDQWRWWLGDEHRGDRHGDEHAGQHDGLSPIRIQTCCWSSARRATTTCSSIWECEQLLGLGHRDGRAGHQLHLGHVRSNSRVISAESNTRCWPRRPCCSPNTGDRVWISDCRSGDQPDGPKRFSRWSSQRSVINGSARAPALTPPGSIQALALAPTDPRLTHISRAAAGHWT